MSTATQTYTFQIDEGMPVLLGDSDLHDAKFDQYARSIVLDDFETDAVDSVRYTLTLYPSQIMFEQFETTTPWKVALGFILVIVVCSGIFLLYDFLMRYEVKRRNQVFAGKAKVCTIRFSRDSNPAQHGLHGPRVAKCRA